MVDGCARNGALSGRSLTETVWVSGAVSSVSTWGWTNRPAQKPDLIQRCAGPGPTVH